MANRHPEWSYPNDTDMMGHASNADPVAAVLAAYGESIMQRLESIALVLEENHRMTHHNDPLMRVPK